MQFTELGLSEPILRAVTAEGYQIPTPIQAKAIPHVLAGKDIMGCAQTGTGKTAAFALPILHNLHTHRLEKTTGKRPIRTLVLSPTRELAGQIADSFRVYGKNTGLRHAVIFGGVNQNPQTRTLAQGVDVVIATPGRLLDLAEQGFVDLRSLEHFVLDEADRMLDMGFIHDIRKIVAKLPIKRQTLMFSATMPNEIRKLADSLLKHPVRVEVAPVSSTAELIEQSVYHVNSKRQKPVLLQHLLETLPITRCLVFTRTKHGADRVAKHLDHAGIRTVAIHGNKSQNHRQRALEGFRKGKVHVLVATDIASRGIDVDGVSHVINFDIPHEPESYVHRIGRTGRAGASGVAVAICDPEERSFLRSIERLTRKTLEVKTDHPVYPAHENTSHEPHAPRNSNRPAAQHPKRGHSEQPGNGAHPRHHAQGNPQSNRHTHPAQRGRTRFADNRNRRP